MSYFKTKMHKIRFRLGLCHGRRPRCGSRRACRINYFAPEMYPCRLFRFLNAPLFPCPYLLERRRSGTIIEEEIPTTVSRLRTCEVQMAEATTRHIVQCTPHNTPTPSSCGSIRLHSQLHRARVRIVLVS